MIKKITNWTFGSIFRTIGRFIAYIIIGVLISLLFIKKDYVKAETYQNAYYFNYYSDSALTNQYSSLSGGIASYKTVDSATSSSVSFTDINWYTSSQPDIRNYAGGRISFPYELNLPIVSKIDDTVRYECDEWRKRSNSDSYYCFTLRSSNNYQINYIEPTVVTQAILYYTNATTGNQSWRTCVLNVNNHAIDCPITNEMQGVLRLRTSTYVYYGSTTSYNYDVIIGKMVNVYADGTQQAIQDQTQQQQQQHNETMQVITGEVNGTGENGTITDEDAESASCGIICKLKHLIKMLSIDNIKYLVIPTEEQMNDLFEQMQTKVTSKLGILGLPITVYTRLMQIAMQYDDSQQNWCLTWNNIQVPNFEDFNIIQGGQWCFSDILQNEKINTFRTVCITIIGGLILLSFIQYLFNCLHRILDVPIQDNYEYFTVEDVTTMDPVTGEVRGRQHKVRRTQKLEVDE